MKVPKTPDENTETEELINAQSLIHLPGLTAARYVRRNGQLYSVRLRVQIETPNDNKQGLYELPPVEDGDALMANATLERLRRTGAISQIQYEILAHAIGWAILHTAPEYDDISSIN